MGVRVTYEGLRALWDELRDAVLLEASAAPAVPGCMVERDEHGCPIRVTVTSEIYERMLALADRAEAEFPSARRAQGVSSWYGVPLVVSEHMRMEP